MHKRTWLAVASGLLAAHLTSPAWTDDDDGPRPAGLTPRVANAKASARARQFIDYGDARFRKQQFSDAYQRYCKASESAPDLPDAYFRQAVAHTALGRYAPAMKSIRRGMSLEPDWAKTTFRLDQLYGDSRAAKQMHLEQLALAAGEPPESADLMFLLGVELFFDGQPSRAKTFLERAAELGVEQHLVRGFIREASRQARRRPRSEDL